MKKSFSTFLKIFVQSCIPLFKKLKKKMIYTVSKALQICFMCNITVFIECLTYQRRFDRVRLTFVINNINLLIQLCQLKY